VRSIIHYGLHFGFPLLVVFLFFRKNGWRNVAILWATMLVDLDHLAANPVFDANRCSVGFHFLHSYIAIAIYFLGLLLSKNFIVKLICLGLCMHMMTDYLDWLLR
jgi:hypothetical protein